MWTFPTTVIGQYLCQVSLEDSQYCNSLDWLLTPVPHCDWLATAGYTEHAYWWFEPATTYQAASVAKLVVTHAGATLADMLQSDPTKAFHSLDQYGYKWAADQRITSSPPTPPP
ncbi:unnamed protein product [Sphagnum tenellum]